MKALLLDGPMGTELGRKGHLLPEGLWSARALLDAPDAVLQVHREYARAGAQVHTANTFRTKRRSMGDAWREAMQIAVGLAREGAEVGQRVAGSVAPLEDCYRPDLSPPKAGEEHRELAQALAEAGVDLLICETFPHLEEAVVAVEACVETGLETWAAFTPGPEADLLTPSELARGAGLAREAGASIVLVNCVSAALASPYVDALADSGLPFGVYANAGASEACLGWDTEPGEAAAAYGVFAAQWLARGACVVGSCCGTGPAHIETLARLLEGP